VAKGRVPRHHSLAAVADGLHDAAKAHPKVISELAKGISQPL